MDVAEALDSARAAREPSLVLTGSAGGSEPRRIALLPGSFDPLTIGHAALAGAAANRADLVVMVYAARTLPKERGAEPPLLAERPRLAAVSAYCATRPVFELGICSHGLLVDQMAAADRLFPNAERSLVIGSDKLLQLFDARWYRDRDVALGRLFERARLVYAVREGEEDAVDRMLSRPENSSWNSMIAPLPVDPTVVAVSSTRVRRSLRAGDDVRDLVPPEVIPFLPAPGA